MRVFYTLLLVVFLSSCSDSGSRFFFQTPAFSATKIAFNKPDDSTNQPPVIEAEFPQWIAVGEDFYFDPRISDPEGDRIKITTKNLPQWMKLHQRKKVFIGTPEISDAGLYDNIWIRVSDGQNNIDLGPLSILVEVEKESLTVSGTPSATVNEGELYYFQPVSHYADGGTLSYTVLNLPAWLRLNSDDGTLSGRPGYFDAGVYPAIKLTASDGLESAELAAFDIVVKDINRPPVFTSNPVELIDEGELYNYSILINDPDGDNLVVDVSNYPAWLVFDKETSVLSGKAGYDVSGIYADISVRATDSKGMVTTQIYDLQVRNINRSPVANPIQLGGNEDELIQGKLVASDPDGDELNFWISQQPSHGVAHLTGGMVIYQAVSDYHGTDELQFSVADDTGARDVASVSFLIESVDDVPVAYKDVAATQQNTPVVINMLENDIGVGDGITVSISGMPANGSVIISEQNKLIYTPLSTFSGEDVFTYQLLDSDNDIASANVQVTVVPECVTNCGKMLSISWRPVNDLDVKGYYLYHGTESGRYTDKLWVGNVFSRDYEINQSGKHFFAATVVNAQGIESLYSNEAMSEMP